MRCHQIVMTLILPVVLVSVIGCSDKGEKSTNSEQPKVTLSVTGGSGIEGQTVPFTVALSGSTTADVTFSYTTQAGTASAPDFTAASGVGKIVAGKTSTTIEVATIDDAAIETAESFDLILSNASVAFTSNDSSATGQIIDNDAAPVVQVSNVTINEGDTAKFVVSLSKTVASSVIFGYHTQVGTAAAVSDFSATSGVDSIPTGQTQVTVSVPTVDDGTDEMDEQFSLLLDSASVDMIDSVGVATIVDNDGPVLTVDYSTQVKPILDAKGCAQPSCHGGGAGGFTLNSTNYNDVVNVIANGHNVVVPFDANNSPLYTKTTANPPFGARMPAIGDTLTMVQQNLIRDWINEGANASAP